MQMLGISNQNSRAGLDCSLFGSESSSAHCLRFDSLWYDMFAIGTAEINYDITIDVMSYNEKLSNYTVVRLLC